MLQNTRPLLAGVITVLLCALMGQQGPLPTAVAPPAVTTAVPAAATTQPAETTPTPADTALPTATPGDTPAHIIVIDAGHQAKGDSTQEPIGPGAAETKARVSSGTRGVATGLAEYELNLQVALKLQAALEGCGYTVVMTRTTHDVNLSNSERAAIANTAGADAFVRIHANGSTNSAVCGVLTICQTANNPYNAALYAPSRALSDCILDGVVAATGANRERVWETDSMSGINWAQVPATILEMGYMSNPEEDRRLSDPTYQDAIVSGIVQGLEAFFAAG